MKTSIRWWQVVALVILFAGIFLTVLSAQQQDQSMRTDLLIKAGIAETGVSVKQVAAMTASSADLALPEYQTLKIQLRKIQMTDPDIRFVYLVGQKQDGTIFFYADSESPESADYSPPGQVYSEATDVLKSVFATGKVAIEGPSPDRWGTWVSGFIPVTDPATGRVIAVFGMDVNASDWNFAIARACAALIVTLVLILIIIIAFGLFQQREQWERRRIEMSEEKFSKAFNTNPALMAMTSVEEGRILDVNASFLTAFGYSREEVIGKTPLDLGLYFYPSERTAIIRQIKETGQVRDKEIRFCRKNRDLLDGTLTSIIIDVRSSSILPTASGRKMRCGRRTSS
ncbi:MAG: PAS domain S-box protein [Methanoregula sp.]|nr:PAS domain S-box protein [Methanoregula sp.]